MKTALVQEDKIDNGLSVTLHRFNGAHQTVRHRHNYCELELVLAGSGTHTLAGVTGSFSAGECWVVSRLDSHALTSTGKMVLLNLTFQCELLPPELAAFFETRSLSCHLDRREIRQVVGLLRKLRRTDHSGVYASLYTGAVLSELLIELLQSARAVPVILPPILVQAAEWTERHFAEPVTLTDFARELSLSPNHAGKLFLRAAGLRFTEYLTGRRLNYVCTLLAHTALPLKSVAAAAGFRSAEYFHHVFKSHFKITPAAYRKQHQTIFSKKFK